MSTADTSPDTAASANALQLQQGFQGQAKGFKGAYDPNQAKATLGQQNQNIQGLQAIAAGRVPSPAELQMRQQAAANTAGTYGAAAALGGRTGGGNLDAALRAAQQSQATTNLQGAQQRAQDQTTAQNQLTQALGAMQAQQQTLRGQDLGYKQDLAGDILGASGQQVTAAGNTVNANATNAASQNAFMGGVVGGATQAAVKSDEREKQAVKPLGAPDMDKLAAALKAVGFEYKNPGTPGENPGRRAGIMAQDALKGGPAGEAMIDTDKTGQLTLDPANSLGIALAMSAEALRRTKGARRAA